MKQFFILFALVLLVPSMLHAEDKAQRDFSVTKISALERLSSEFLVADAMAANDEISQDSEGKAAELSTIASDNSAVSNDAKVSSDTKLMKGIKNLKNLKVQDAVDYLSTSTVDAVKNDIKNIPVKDAVDYLSSTPIDKIAKDVTGQNLSEIIPSEKIDKMIEAGKNLDVAKVASSASGYAMDVVLNKIISVIFSYIIELIVSIVVFVFIVVMIIKSLRRRKQSKIDALDLVAGAVDTVSIGDILP